MSAPATREDVEAIVTLLRNDLVEIMSNTAAGLREEITNTAAGLREEITNTAAGLREEMGTMETRLGARIDRTWQEIEYSEARLRADMRAKDELDERRFQELKTIIRRDESDSMRSFNDLFPRVDRLETSMAGVLAWEGLHPTAE